MYENIHSSFIHKNPKLEITEMPITWRKNKYIMIYTYDGIPKEWGRKRRNNFILLYKCIKASTVFSVMGLI